MYVRVVYARGGGGVDLHSGTEGGGGAYARYQNLKIPLKH